jgi:hypothetical protein
MLGSGLVRPTVYSGTYLQYIRAVFMPSGEVAR